MTPEEALQKVPHLISPLHLAIADSRGKLKGPPHLQLTNRELVKAWLTPNGRLAINFPFQHGKQCAHDTPVWTENGWKTHGELKVGDYVYSPIGVPVKVEALSPESIGDYEVEFSDGSVIQCHARHEWYVYSRTRGKWCILETQQMIKERLKETIKESRYNLSVPRILPLIAPDQDLSIKPYVLGAWLGDGISSDGVICHANDDWEVINEVISQGYKPTRRWIHKPTGVQYSRFSKLYAQLRRTGLLNNKHIPEIYLTASIEQRMELLAGLIDTDGNYTVTGGQYRFTNTNKDLIKQISFLACSLGFKVEKVQEYKPVKSSSGIQGRKKVYVVAFSPTSIIPCRIPRKQAKKVSEACRLAIVDVRKAEPKLGRCIQVEGGLYLVGERLLCTHNSVLCSTYFPAWVLLRWPETRIALASYEETYSAVFGSRVRDIVNNFGPALGIKLRDDSSAKGEWVIEKHGGGMVCKGRGGALVGRPVDLLILDDMIKNQEEAQSPNILDSLWDWYCTVAYSRLGPEAPVIGVGTRWGPKDLFGRWEQESKAGGDQFTVINLKAIAGEDDVLGRKPGEALWPERVPLARLQMVEKLRGRWFKACWQGEPEETTGLHFQPRLWPTYSDVGDAWRYQGPLQWDTYRKVESTILIAVDWAQAGKKKSNKTAITTAALVDDGKLLILDVYDKALRYEENAPTLDEICKRYSIFNNARMFMIVSSDDDMLSDAMVTECRRYPHIPEIKRMGIRSQGKLLRAQSGIIRSQNGMFLLPNPAKPWFERMADQLSAFSGEEGAEDDIADTFGILGRLADEFKPCDLGGDDDSVLGAPGYESDLW